jgi:mxaJ protein
MYSATNAVVAGVVGMVCVIGACASPLRVCADPNDLPYSNKEQQGFENQIAKLIAHNLGEQLSYYWYPQRGRFFARTLEYGVCDVVMGVPSGMKSVAATQPYYRSTYVFITRRDSHIHITSLDDPRLRSLKIGVHIFGDQNESPPPVNALIQRGIVHNLVGFSIFGHLDETNPAANLIKAVEDRQVDVAIAWGPLAGYFSNHSHVPLQITPIPDDPAEPDLPFHFDIGIGVRKGDTRLQETLNAEVVRLRPQIQQILRNYGIPQLTLPNEAARFTED